MKKATQKQFVLEYLKKRGSITSYESFKYLFDTRLSDKIYQLKKDGYEFKEEWIEKKNKLGNKVRFKRYILENKSATAVTVTQKH